MADAADLAVVLVDTVRELAAVRAERNVWRMMAKQAIDELAARHRELTRLRDSHHHLIDEYRRLRVRILDSEAA